MDNQLIIGVDTGNRCIKTASQIFVAGLKQSNDRMPFTHGVMEYDNKYFMLSQKRVSYLQDKTQTDEYFILTLFAIAKELDYRKYISHSVWDCRRHTYHGLKIVSSSISAIAALSILNTTTSSIKYRLIMLRSSHRAMRLYIWISAR